MDAVLVSAGLNNAEACVALAKERGLGVEVMAFAMPDVLDGDWQGTLAHYKALLAGVPGPITLHGPFMDMAPGSPDGRINAICVDRYQHALRCAAELGAARIVFHANFIASIQNLAYRNGWHARNVTFWAQMADYAQRVGVPLAMENMWEFDPSILADVLAEVNHPYLGACLDVGHAHLFGPQYSFETWVASLQPWLTHVHVNNNNGGGLDVHQALGHGVLDYPTLLNQLRALHKPLTFVLEMYDVDDMRASLPYFELPQPVPAVQPQEQQA